MNLTNFYFTGVLDYLQFLFYSIQYTLYTDKGDTNIKRERRHRVVEEEV